ncbi:dihydrofolate reductase [Ascosphaera acerosa]|nr:dihydrofolate reductase [Ascosphaera acerosa]
MPVPLPVTQQVRTSGRRVPLLLIVATTPCKGGLLGIGKDGGLPWPHIKTDMSFFARVTARPPTTPSVSPQVAHEGQAAGASAQQSDNDYGGAGRCINAVIMGRRTYDSIPQRFRPLGGRFNVVITRDGTGQVRSRVEREWREARRRERERERERAEQRRVAAQPSQQEQQCRVQEQQRQVVDTTSCAPGADEIPDVSVCDSLQSALHDLQAAFASSTSPLTHAGSRGLGSIYVIGGAEIYRTALQLDTERLGLDLRIVMTEIEPADADGDGRAAVGFDCDTFFPLSREDLQDAARWRQVDSATLSSWVGEDVPGEWQAEGNVRVRMLGYQKVQG